MRNSLKDKMIMFVVMVIVGMLFNPMNCLAYSFSDLYLSVTLFYGGLLMASNMIWAHEIVHYLTMGHFNKKDFVFGIILSLFIVVFLLRGQLFVDEQNWLLRMIPHHSTALTTSNRLIEKEKFKKNSRIYRLAKDIIYNQEREILFMKSMLK